MSDTPRTDALANAPCPVELTFSEWHQYKYRALCCQLERELSTAKAQIATLEANRREDVRKCAEAICPICAKGEHAEWQRDPTPMYWHESVPCKAHAIRAAFPEIFNDR